MTDCAFIFLCSPPPPKIELLQRAKVWFPSRSQKTTCKERKSLWRSKPITLWEWLTRSHTSSQSPTAHTFETANVHSGGMFRLVTGKHSCTALRLEKHDNVWISCQFTGCSFGAAAILQYEMLKLRVQAARDEEKAETNSQVRFNETKPCPQPL